MIDVVHVHCTLQDIKEAIPVFREMILAHETYMRDNLREGRFINGDLEIGKRIAKAYCAGLAACEAVCEALSDGEVKEE